MQMIYLNYQIDLEILLGIQPVHNKLQLLSQQNVINPKYQLNQIIQILQMCLKCLSLKKANFYSREL